MLGSLGPMMNQGCLSYYEVFKITCRPLQLSLYEPWVSVMFTHLQFQCLGDHWLLDHIMELIHGWIKFLLSTRIRSVVIVESTEDGDSRVVASV